MKKILTLLILLIVISGVNANSMVEPVSPVGMAVVKTGNIFKVYYKGEKAGTVKVFIYNAKGNVVFVETLRKTGSFMRPYNFTSLPEGDYRIVLTDKQGKRTEKVTHTLFSLDEVAFLRQVNKIENRYLLTVLNQGKHPLTVKIYNKDYNLVYQYREMMDDNFVKIYNLNDVPGACTFEITHPTGKKIILTNP